MAEVVAGTLSEARDAEVLIERPDGSRITVVVNISPLKSEGGDIIGAINCFYDITARKETEEALRDSDRRKTEFLAMLAHELRNPLAPIRNSLAAMRLHRKLESSNSPALAMVIQGPNPTGLSPNHPIDAAMDVLDRQVGQMVKLVDDLLDGAYQPRQDGPS
jgi:signal transduction histidine kinase